MVWSRSLERAEMAIVLEPEVTDGRSLQMAPLMLVAAGDSLGALMPPQVPLHFRWPDRLIVNGGEAGRIHICAATVDRPEAAPDWLVVGFGVQVIFPTHGTEPGDMAHRTALVEEGGGDLDRTRILESLAAHLLTWLNIWQDDGFRPVAQSFIDRLETEQGVIEIHLHGERLRGKPLGLDEGASLILKPQAGPARSIRLQDAMATVEEPSAQ